MSTDAATTATVSRNKEKVYDEASNQFSVMFKKALEDNSVKQNINDAFNMQKNENILNVIYSRFEHHIEKVMKMNDVPVKGDPEPNIINGIVFDHFITILSDPTSPLSQFIQEFLNKHSSDTKTTLFFIVKENLIQYLTKKSGGGLLNTINNAANNFSKDANEYLGIKDETYDSKVTGEGPNFYKPPELAARAAARAEEKNVNASKTLNDDVTQQLKQIVSRMKGEIQNRIPDKINKIFDDDAFKKKLVEYTDSIIAKIQESIVNSPFFKTDLFSIVYFYKLMKKIEKDGDDTKIVKINEVLNNLKTGGGGTPVATGATGAPGATGPGATGTPVAAKAAPGATGTPVAAKAAPGAPGATGTPVESRATGAIAKEAAAKAVELAAAKAVELAAAKAVELAAAKAVELAAAKAAKEAAELAAAADTSAAAGKKIEIATLSADTAAQTPLAAAPDSDYQAARREEIEKYLSENTEKAKFEENYPDKRGPLVRVGGRRTRRLSRGKKRTQKKRHNKKKNTTCRKK